MVKNRFGACFEVNLAGIGQKRVDGRAFISELKKRREKSKSAPPYKKISTSTNKYINHKPVRKHGAGFYALLPKNISLRKIKLEHLQRVSTLEPLYAQALKAGWFEHSEANVRNFISAAVRATRVSGDAVRIFVAITKRGLWHHVTQAQEDRAMEVLKRHRQKHPESFGLNFSSANSNDECNNPEQSARVGALMAEVLEGLGRIEKSEAN